MTGRRLLRRRSIVAASVLLGVSVSLWSTLGSDAPAATAKPQSCTASSCMPTYTAEYKGTFSFRQDYEGAGTSAGAFLRTTDTLTWDEKVITKARNPQDPSTWTYQKTLTASGSTTVASSNGPSFSCTLTQAANPNLNLLTAGPNTLKAGTVDVSAFFPSDQLTASGTSPLCGGLTDYDCTDAGCVGVCSDAWASAADAANSQKFDDAVTPSMNAAESRDPIPYGATQRATSKCLLTITGPTPKSVGTETATRSISGTLTIGGGCSVAAAVLGATPDSGPANAAKAGLKVKATSNAPGDYFRAFKVTLRATASGGCKPYKFKWRRVNQPTPKVPGVTVTVVPQTKAAPPDPAVSLLPVVLTCRVSDHVKKQYGVSAKSRFMTPCWGPVTYRVDVKDTPKGQAPLMTGKATVYLHWAPECLPDDLRKDYLKERSALEQELHKELLQKFGESLGIEAIVEYVGLGEFAPAFFLKDVAELGIQAEKQFQRATDLAELLSEPPC